METVFYDGGCGLCHRVVKFLLWADSEGTRFRFAPLDSEAFREALSESVRRGLPDSVVVIHGGVPLVKSTAVIHLMKSLGGLWKVLGWIGVCIPRVVRDAMYDFVARIRLRLFAKPKDVCPMMPKELRSRFLF